MKLTDDERVEIAINKKACWRVETDQRWWIFDGSAPLSEIHEKISEAGQTVTVPPHAITMYQWFLDGEYRGLFDSASEAMADIVRYLDPSIEFIYREAV